MTGGEKSLTIVIKLGSSSLVDEVTREPRIANMSLIVETIVKLRRAGHRIIIVSSGAIAVGMKRVNISSRPKHLSKVQLLAAIGQGRLIALWDDLFRQLDQPIAQILITRNDIHDYKQFQNAKNTIEEILKMGIIPIVNENDTLSVQEIKFGDNDTLSAITAGMCDADYLFLLTDVDCLYTDNPRVNPDAKPITIVNNLRNLNVNTKSSGSSMGTGGMTTKIIAADLGTSAGVITVISKSTHPQHMMDIIEYSQSVDNADDNPQMYDDLTEKEFLAKNETEYNTLIEKKIPLHTRFLSSKDTVKKKEFWLLHGLNSSGAIIIDLGCYQALTRKNKAGLLPVGIIGVEGVFHEMECVSIKLGSRKLGTDELDLAKPVIEVGKARPNYSSLEIDRIKSKQSDEIFEILGGSADTEYVVHRENLLFPLHLNPSDDELLKQLSI